MKLLRHLAPVILVLVAFSSLAAREQDEKRNYSLKGENILAEEKKLDASYEEATRRMGDIIKRYNLMAVKEVVSLPYQVEYRRGKDFITMEKHSFKRSAFDRKRILSVLKKKMTIYTDGAKVIKIETTIEMKEYGTDTVNQVTLLDPTPLSGGTGDILITQVKNGKTIIAERKLQDFRNTTAYPLRNDLKRNFLIGHIGDFSHYLLFIGESRDSEKRRSDDAVKGFLKTALKFQ